MENTILALVCIVGVMAYYEISALKKVIQSQEKRLNELAKRTGQEDLSSYWVSDSLKAQVIQLKRDGKTVEAVKAIREQTQMDLVTAKQYVDTLN